MNGDKSNVLETGGIIPKAPGSYHRAICNRVPLSINALFEGLNVLAEGGVGRDVPLDFRKGVDDG